MARPLVIVFAKEEKISSVHRIDICLDDICGPTAGTGGGNFVGSNPKPSHGFPGPDLSISFRHVARSLLVVSFAKARNIALQISVRIGHPILQTSSTTRRLERSLLLFILEAHFHLQGSLPVRIGSSSCQSPSRIMRKKTMRLLKRTSKNWSRISLMMINCKHLWELFVI